MVFGVNALFTKPGQSLAPMIVLNILNQFGYEYLKEADRNSNLRYGEFCASFSLKTSTQPNNRCSVLFKSSPVI